MSELRGSFIVPDVVEVEERGEADRLVRSELFVGQSVDFFEFGLFMWIFSRQADISKHDVSECQVFGLHVPTMLDKGLTARSILCKS
mmetsp:Transcript_45900/g.99712  ORF Transcript_45900/g.99712 Transcript_45900/m.99712 type:complete len:87 (-) Transcript_45900:205-465(-)